MNDKQKWFLLVFIFCICAIGVFYSETKFIFRFGTFGSILFGAICSSIAGFLLFKDN